jgi:hypothetical protein
MILAMPSPFTLPPQKMLPPDFSEMSGKGYADGQGAGDQGDEIRIEADGGWVDWKQEDPHEEIERAPEEVDERGRVAYAGRLGEGGWEWGSLEAAYQMGETVAETCAREEEGDVIHREGRIRSRKEFQQCEF